MTVPRRFAVPILGMIMLILGMPARAVQLDAQACQVMAIWARDIVWARDMGAEREKVRAWVDSQRVEHPMFIVLSRIFTELWDSKIEGVAVMALVHRDCAARRGAYGSDT